MIQQRPNAQPVIVAKQPPPSTLWEKSSAASRISKRSFTGRQSKPVVCLHLIYWWANSNFCLTHVMTTILLQEGELRSMLCWVRMHSKSSSSSWMRILSSKEMSTTTYMLFCITVYGIETIIITFAVTFASLIYGISHSRSLHFT